MGQFGTLCLLASCGGRELGRGMGQVGTHCVPWPAGRTGKWDVGWDRLVPDMSLGQLREKGTGAWDVGWDRLVPNVSLGQLG